MAEEYDGIIIGAGPNGLTVAAYLAKAGLKILLLEKRFEAGGGLATEQVTLPGFLHNTHAVYMPMVDYAPPLKDFEDYLTKDYDLEFAFPSLVMCMPFADGSSLRLYQDVDKTCESIAEFSKKDAETYRRIQDRFRVLTEDFLGPATYEEAKPAFEQMIKLQATDVGREISQWTEKTPRGIVNELFEHDKVRTLFLYLSCMWGLHYNLEGVSYLVPLLFNRATNYRLVVGGSHHLAHLFTKVLYRHGGMIISPVAVKRIVIENGAAVGVELEDGTFYKASKFVASSLDPYQTFLKYVGEENLEGRFVTRTKDWKWELSSLFHVHLALAEAPQFQAATSCPDLRDALITIVGYENEESLVRHYDAIHKGELYPGGFNCSFPSMHDPKQAPEGKHTGLISLHAPYNLKDGGAEKWFRIREQEARRCVELLTKYAPNITEDNILWHYITTPLDIENKFADMVQGSYKQGAYLPLQMGYLRPNEECSQYATPIRNLYVCGASTFPGGLITFGPGYNAANKIAVDLGLDRWWGEPECIRKAKTRGTL
ncbi:MAG TPA: NAD(P)/FAD-dependent oxidoreductase [Desulfomonilaceae bacterium]|nr:NAD(P)/FAD-dependent oxidoreductase [Desulfomonilaceae bacterium]